MKIPLKATIGPYVHTTEALDRAKELSREELRKLLAASEEDDSLDRSGRATGSDTADL